MNATPSGQYVSASTVLLSDESADENARARANIPVITWHHTSRAGAFGACSPNSHLESRKDCCVVLSYVFGTFEYVAGASDFCSYVSTLKRFRR
jgi:hypothetical protein